MRINTARVAAVLDKEWVEIRGNKVISGTIVALPLILVALVVGTSFFLQFLPDSEFGSEINDFVPYQISGLLGRHALMVMLNDQYMFYLLMIPMMLPLTIATYGIVGEKKERSLEPLLATPLTTEELLIAKTLSGVLPATAMGWLSYALVVVASIFIVDPMVVYFLIRPVWGLGMLLLSPLLALLTSLLGVLISARVNDVRAAQSVMGAVVLPLVGVSLAVLMGKLYVSATLLMVSCAVLVAMIAAAMWLAVRAFDREAILTRWS